MSPCVLYSALESYYSNDSALQYVLQFTVTVNFRLSAHISSGDPSYASPCSRILPPRQHFLQKRPSDREYKDGAARAKT